MWRWPSTMPGSVSTSRSVHGLLLLLREVAHLRLCEFDIIKVAMRHQSDRGCSHLIACGLIGEPVPPVMISGGPQKKNS